MYHEVEVRVPKGTMIGLWFAISALGYLVGACNDVQTKVLADARSPDGSWRATAYDKQWGGPGTAAAATTIELQQGSQPGQEILVFSHQDSTMSITLTWPQRRHLLVSYAPLKGDAVKLEFQAVKMGDIQIEAIAMP